MTERPPAEATPDGSSAHGPGDLVFGGVALAFGVGVLLYVRGFPELPDGQPGPALFPGIIGGLFVVFGTALVVQWFGRRRSSAAPDGAAAPATPDAGGDGGGAEPVAPSRSTRLQALAMLASVVVYLLVVDVLGFILTMFSLLLLLTWMLGARLLVAAGAAVATTLLTVLLFQRLLLVPLPTGLLG